MFPLSRPPFAPLLSRFQDFICCLYRLKPNCGIFIAWLDIGMIFLGEASPALFHRLKIRIAVEFQLIKRAHCIARAAAGPPPATAIKAAATKPAGIPARKRSG